MDSRITRLAARQHGAVSRQQLLALGLSPDTIRSLVRDRRVGLASRGVYVLHGTVDSVEREAMVAALRCGPDARIVGERMLGIVGVHGANRAGPFEVLTRPGRVVTGVPWRNRSNPCPVTAHAALVSGIPSLRPARLVLEYAVSTPDDADLATVVDGLRWGRTGLRSLLRLLAEVPEHPGVVRLARSGLIDEGAAESPKERELDAIVAHLAPQRQVELLGHRVDFYFAAARLVLEYDGALHLAPHRRARDAARDAELKAAGYLVVRLTADDLLDESALVRRIESLIATRVAVVAL